MDEPPVAELVDEELVVAALPVLDRVARRLARQTGAQVDDLLSLGHFALTDLIRRYDPARMPFELYIQQRLRWAMIDGLRRETLHRRAFLRARAIGASGHLSDATSARTDGMPPSSQGHRARLSELLREHALAMGMKLLVSEGRETAVTASSTNPERLTHRRALIEALREAVDSLEDERMRTIVQRYYFGGEGLVAIAHDLGITKGWASRLHASAVAILARRLRALVSSR